MPALDLRVSRRRNALLALLWVALPVAILFLGLNVSLKAPWLAVFNGLALLVSLGLLVALRRGAPLHLAAVGFLMVFYLNIAATMARPDIHPGVTSWLPVIPVLAYLLLAVRCAFPLALGAVTVTLMAYFAGSELAPYRWNPLLIVHVVTPMLGVFIVCHFYSRSQHALTITLLERALRDPLKGLWNRAKLEREFDREQRRAARSGRPLSLLLIDLDHFKRINDCFGHAAGDAVLMAFARLLRERTRETDLHCRIGGEEFAALLPDTDVKGAAVIAEHLRQALAMEGVFYQGERIHVTLSAGAVELGRDGDTWSALFRTADARLYACKERGRNCVLWEETMATPWPVAS